MGLVSSQDWSPHGTGAVTFGMCFFSIPNIKNGLVKSGIYALNLDAVVKAKMIPSTLYDKSMFSSPSNSSETESSTPCVLPLV